MRASSQVSIDFYQQRFGAQLTKTALDRASGAADKETWNTTVVDVVFYSL